MDPLKVTLVAFGALLFSTLPPALLNYYSFKPMNADLALNHVISIPDAELM